MTQVQVFTLMTLTLFVTAPIMIIGGVIFAIREDGPLSLILLVAIPILLLSVGQVAIRMHPQFTKMQNRIDRVNQVLREQISGMRVVRAFVREPDEAVRFGKANADLTETSLKTGRMMAVMFPAVLLTINISSVAAVWFGADRINAGQMQVGSLVAFLSYLIQILMAVMMGTFVLMMGPRASVCAGRIQEVLRTSSSVVNPTDGVTELPGAVSLELRHAEFAFPGAEQPVLHDINFRVEAGETLAIIGSTGSGKTALAEPDRAAVRRHQRAGADQRGRRPRARPTPRRTAHRLRPAEAVPVLGHRGHQRALRQPGRHRRRGVGGAWRSRRRATSWRRSPTSSTRRSPRAAPTCPAGSGNASPSPGPSRTSPPSTCSTTRSPPSTSPPTPGCAPRSCRSPPMRSRSIVAQRVSTIVRADQILVLEEGRIVGLGTHRELLESCPTYQEIVESQFVAEEEVA